MPRCALVNTKSGLVENLIMAGAGDEAPSGFLLALDPPDFVQIGTPYRDGAFVESEKAAPAAATGNKASLPLIGALLVVDGELWGTVYSLNSGELFPVHAHPTEDQSHLTILLSGGIRLHGDSAIEGVELWAAADQNPVLNWPAGQAHGWTALENGTRFANLRKIRVKV